MLYLVLLLVLGSLGLLLTALRTHDTLWAWASVGVSVVAAVLLLFDWAGRRLAADKTAPTDASPAETTAPVPPTTAASAPTSSTGHTTESPSSTDPAQANSAEPGPEHPEESAAATAAGETAPTAAASPGNTPTADAVGRSASAVTPDQDQSAPGAERSSGRHLATGDTARHGFPTRPGYRTPSRVAPAGAPGSVPVSLDPAVEPPEEDTDAADAIRVAELSDEVRVLDERPRYHLAGCAWVADRPTLPLPVHEARELGFSPCGLCRPDAMLTQRHHTPTT